MNQQRFFPGDLIMQDNGIKYYYVVLNKVEDHRDIHEPTEQYHSLTCENNRVVLSTILVRKDSKHSTFELLVRL